MKLNYEQIKQATRGAEKVASEDGEFRFYRFNEGELEFYRTSEFYTKAFATSDVELEFKTDATEVFIKGTARVAVSYRTWYTLEVFSNGKRVGVGEFEKSFELGEGEKTVRIVLPQFSALAISEIDLIGATFFEAVKPQKKMFFYGDSISQGYDTQYPSNKYTALTARALGVEGYNKAIGGEVFQPELAAVKSENAPDFISVAFGTNDCGTTREVFLKNSRAFYENLSANYPNAKIFALSPIWRANYADKQTVGDFFDVEKQIKEIAASLPNVIFIPGFDLVPHDTKYFYDRCLHPSDEGFEIYAKNLVKAIKKYFC